MCPPTSCAKPGEPLRPRFSVSLLPSIRSAWSEPPWSVSCSSRRWGRARTCCHPGRILSTRTAPRPGWGISRRCGWRRTGGIPLGGDAGRRLSLRRQSLRAFRAGEGLPSSRRPNVPAATECLGRHGGRGALRWARFVAVPCRATPNAIVDRREQRRRSRCPRDRLSSGAAVSALAAWPRSDGGLVRSNGEHLGGDARTSARLRTASGPSGRAPRERIDAIVVDREHGDLGALGRASLVESGERRRFHDESRALAGDEHQRLSRRSIAAAISGFRRIAASQRTTTAAGASSARPRGCRPSGRATFSKIAKAPSGSPASACIACSAAAS